MKYPQSDDANRLTSAMIDTLPETQKILARRLIKQLKSIWRSFKSRPTALIGMGIIITFVLVAIFAPSLTSFGPTETVYGESGVEVLQPPSSQNILGTTNEAQDVFTQWAYGTRVVLIVGFVSALGIITIGTTVGVISGYMRGTTDLLLMSVVDILYGLPFVPLILVLVLIMGASLQTIIIGFVLVGWRSTARVVRSETLSLSNRSFVKSARASGASNIRIMYYHILPNLLPIIIIQSTMVVASAILIEASISFLGLGVQNSISWGTMLQSTFTSGAIRYAWWWAVPPGLSITVLVLAFFFVSRAIEDIFSTDGGGVEQ